MPAPKKTVTWYTQNEDGNTEAVQGPPPMKTMFVKSTAVLPGDEIVLGTDKRYPVLSKLAAHNGHPRRRGDETLVRRPFRGDIR